MKPPLTKHSYSVKKGLIRLGSSKFALPSFLAALLPVQSNRANR